MPPLDFSHSQPVDNSAMQPLSSASPDAGFAREVQSQLSASMAQPMPGAESMMGMPAVPGAEQAISPLVQMIMRMPGHIGLASSFFEVLGNFFLPQTDMLSMFDPANFGLHIDLSAVMPGDHAGLEHIDFSLLPHDAPLLDHIGHADLSSAHSLDLASDKLNLSLGGNSHFLSDHGSTSVSMGSQFNVSGPASFASPKFEGAGGLVSGPNLSENFNANSLASNNRLFSDGAGIAHAGRSMMTQTASASSAAGSSLNATAMPQTATASSLSANPADNVSAHGSNANNVSYSVFENLAGNKDVLASNSIGDSYHSTVGNVGGQGTGATADVASKATANSVGGQAAGADSLHKAAAPSHNAHASSASHTASNENPGGLQAKSLSLDGSKVELKAEHPKLDDIKHEPKHLADAGTQHKSDVAANAKADHAAEHKVAQQPEHKPEHAPDHKPDHKTEHKVASADVKPEHKLEHKPEHKLDATSHAAKPAVAQHVTPKAATVAQAQPSTAIDAKVEAGQASGGEQNQFGQPAQDGAQGGAQANTNDATATNASDKLNIADKANGTGHGLEQQAAPVSKVYTIRSGDCLWNIAKDQLGDATKWSDIYKMNGDVLGANPGMIRPGMSINLPGAESTSIGNIAHYTVKPGDNLWDIAKNQMGDSTKWGDLYKANQEIIGSNPSLIQPGQELTINTGAPDPASMQLSSAGTTPVSLGQSPAPTTAFNAGADNTVAMSQNGYQAGFSGEGAAPIAHQGDMAAGQMPQPAHQAIQQPMQPVSMQPAAKVLPALAEPDAIIQPAHAAEITPSGLSPEAANIAGLDSGASLGQKGVVNTSTASDLLSIINKRK